MLKPTVRELPDHLAYYMKGKSGVRASKEKAGKTSRII
jgi:hypothetical protein